MIDSCTRLNVFFFFFNDTATTEIYTLSLHDALPIFPQAARRRTGGRQRRPPAPRRRQEGDRARHGARQARLDQDRKSTRLNSSHSQISYAGFCLKKKTVRSQSSSQHVCIMTTGRSTS